MDILGKLFSNPHRARVLRLFYLSPERTLASKEVAKLSKIPLSAARKETKVLSEVGFLKPSIRTDEVLGKSKRGHKISKRKVAGFMLSTTFPLLLSLKNLVVTASPISREKILSYFKNGGIKVVILGGVFNEDSMESIQAASSATRLDMLLVGNGLGKLGMESFVDRLGAEMGRELVWASMSVTEFEHRLSMRDKLLRDLFDFPHEFLVDRMGLSEKAQKGELI